MKAIHRYLFFGLILAPLFLHAQNEEDRIIDNQIWADYYQYYYIKPNWQFYGDAGVRTVVDKWSWFMIYARPSIRWKKHELWELHGGVGVIQTFNVDDVNTFEIRPWQGIRVNWPTFKPIRFNHYFRLEERFNFPTDTWTLEFNLRIRYKFALNVPIYTFENKSKLFLIAYVEFFGNIGQQLTEKFSNRSRFAFGAGYKMNDTWTFEAHFVSQFSRTMEEDLFKTSDRLFQIKVRRFVFKKDYKSKLPPD